MQRTVLAAAMRRVLSWVVILVAVCGASASAHADPRAERDAQALRKTAIEEDNLNVNYAGAVKKLQAALGKCGANRCGAYVKAGLFRDLGAMQVLSGSVDEGKASFAQAIALDSSIDLDPAYKNPMLDGLWADVKKEAAVEGGGTRGRPSFARRPALRAISPTPRRPKPKSTPRSRSTWNMEVSSWGKVVAKYKATGMSDWKSVDLKKVGDGYGALIPCKDILQGSVQYYVVGFNTQNDPVATSGSRNKPFTVAVNAQISGPVPSLPGRDPPAQCEDTTASECPPDFPGCKAPKKEPGEDCEKDAQCKDGSCIGGKCIEKKGGGEDCESDKECSSESCSGGKCSSKKGGGDTCANDDECTSGKCDDEKCASASAEETGTLTRVWVGLSIQGDIYFMPAASNVCLLNAAGTVPVNTAGYRCVDPTTSAAFPPDRNTNNLISSKNDQVLGGAVFGNLRILASLDYALNPNMMIGARAGYVLFTDPSSGTPGAAFAPIHVEARFTYLFGHNALISQTIAPLIFAGVGAGEFDAFVPVTVTSTTTMPINLKENAWLTSGPGFFALGAGVRVKLGAKVAGTAAFKFEGPFGGGAGFLPGIAPELGVQLGF